ncbi:MAG: hypothetical protein CVU50_02870 [Candidatus Cloacimonetes bacterium HGW-Cloacimonetes-3]|jgi:hypothetical protein|nr:MAG: hypothetical protein CVU50_02870 [Candidatus Cloacimonetes bacterium HGW-Cloacimonetes-3]
MKYNQNKDIAVIKTTQMQLKLLVALLLLSSLAVLNAEACKPLELRTGVSALLYQHIYSFQSSLAWEASVAKPLVHNICAEAGLRLGADPVLPEAYLRFGAQHRFKLWNPEAGIELGISNRARFQHDKLLLSEMQQATDSDISPVYFAFYASPLSFCLKDKYLLCIADLQIGSHISHLGRTARIQLSLINLGVLL